MIEVSISVEDGDLAVVIADDGPGCGAARRQEFSHGLSAARSMATHGIGIYSVHRRLAAEYGSCYGVQLQPVSRGFSVRVTLPIIEEIPKNGQRENQSGDNRRGGDRTSPRAWLSGAR